ncbi:E3 ubiquitin-protein ligase RHF2A-like isoform X2 [Phragmites australis]|uniref:E3 ubiquitin-protein ligase RHF2A-like isoform X2 n=1 Tax=Phragmites australis TaxID=29695 RepID=UPI002D765F12|nr:E3 ubiquitin-protein ligase RHF2A-like isoform X2 [Phragmites australis]
MTMDEKAQMEKLSSAAAFVEGGVQDACDDACSICLEAFSDSDPSAVTRCNHEFHLQCILEWCQRSSQCPMCWQAICMKDPMSQELLEAVEQERNLQENRARTTTVVRHPLLGDFEVPVGVDDAEFEERIIQHLAAASAIRRSHRHVRREGRRSRSAAYGHPQILIFSSTEGTSGHSISSNSRQEGKNEHSPAVISARPFPTVAATEETAADTSVHDTTLVNAPAGSNNRVSRNQSSPVSQDGAGPSDLQSFSDTLKSRLQSVSTMYKDSITKSTRGWKERWFTQNNTISNLGSEVRREVNAGIAAVSRMMERLETRDGTGPSSTSPTNIHSASDTNNQGAVPSKIATVVNDTSSSATCVSRSGSQ